MDEDWKHIGDIGVDAGICWIGDPCYILADGDQPGLDYDKLIDSWPRDKTPETKERYKQNLMRNMPDLTPKELEISVEAQLIMAQALVYEHELGICVSTGYGDGSYPVYARIKDGRVREVKVVFISDEDLEDEQE